MKNLCNQESGLIMRIFAIKMLNRDKAVFTVDPGGRLASLVDIEGFRWMFL